MRPLYREFLVQAEFDAQYNPSLALPDPTAPAKHFVATAERAGKLLDEIVPSIQKTSELVQEISAASAEQSESVVQIGGAMGQLSKATQQNASASEELAATSEELSGQAEQLQQSVAFFKTGDDAPVVRGALPPRFLQVRR